jgi:hypothetical protein
MLPKEERDALMETLQRTIMENVPEALESREAEGEFVYRIENKIFCTLLASDHQLELRFPDIPYSDAHSGQASADRGMHLVIKDRTDIDGDAINNAIMASATAARS